MHHRLFGWGSFRRLDHTDCIHCAIEHLGEERLARRVTCGAGRRECYSGRERTFLLLVCQLVFKSVGVCVAGRVVPTRTGAEMRVAQ